MKAFCTIVLVFGFVGVLAASGHAQTAATFSGGSDGAVIAGYDSRTCAPAIAGAIRYSSQASAIEVCKPLGNSCPNIGDVCSDGSVYAGLSPDGNVPMFTTPADAGQFTWNNGNSSGYVDTSLPNCTNGIPGTNSSCQTGWSNTTALGLADSDSVTAGTQPHQASQYCSDLNAHGHSDWYLPAQDELHTVLANKAAIGGFAINYYWSSSEYDSAGADVVNSNVLTRGNHIKYNSYPVRCVRKSSSPPMAHNWVNWGD